MSKPKQKTRIIKNKRYIFEANKRYCQLNCLNCLRLLRKLFNHSSLSGHIFIPEKTEASAQFSLENLQYNMLTDIKDYASIILKVYKVV